MAERRMFTQKIIDSDAFLDMPLSTQALYFHLNMRADDDGFVNNPKRIQRTIGASEDDLKLLIAKRFIIGFEVGVIVIKHWRMHNAIRKDRYSPTQYQEELSRLELKENNAYTERLQELPEPDGNHLATTWQPDGNHLAPQVRIGKDSIGKDSIGEESEGKGKARENTHTLLARLLPDYIMSDLLKEKVSEWIKYKTERREPYKEQGMKSLLRQIENNYLTYGEKAVCDLIEECMASNWKGIIFERLKKQPARQNQKSQQSGNVFLDLLEDEI